MELIAKNRTVLGKKTSVLRASGWIPAELYGHGVPNVHLSISAKEFAKMERAGSSHAVITLVTDDGKKHSAIISDIVRDHLSENIFALDFHKIRMDEKIQTRVSVEFTGEAPASKEGFVVVKVMNEMEVEALPKDLPHHITVDLSALVGVGSTVHIEDIKLPHGVKIIATSNAVVATIAEKAKEEAPEPVVSAEPATGTPATETTDPVTPA